MISTAYDAIQKSTLHAFTILTDCFISSDIDMFN